MSLTEDEKWAICRQAIDAVIDRARGKVVGDNLAADVSDLQIGMALSSTTLCVHGENRDPFDTCRYCIGDDAIAAVRALLDTQAAAHGGRISDDGTQGGGE